MDKELYFTPWYTWDLRGPTWLKCLQSTSNALKHCMFNALSVENKKSKELTSVLWEYEYATMFHNAYHNHYTKNQVYYKLVFCKSKINKEQVTNVWLKIMISTYLNT